MTITEEQQQAIREYFAGRNIPAGMGNKQAACSLAGINLALSGRLTDAIPRCMSKQIGRWIICVQDEMTDDIRNSDCWRELLPRAAGTGRQHEERRAQMIIEWMWETVLPYIQPLADKGGYGDEWRTMCQERTEDAANAARWAAKSVAAYAAAYAAKAAAYAAAYAVDAAAYAAAYAVDVADAAADAGAPVAADAVGYAAYAAANAVGYAAYAAANAAANAAKAAAEAKAWEHFDPCALLERLIAVSEETL